MEHLIALLDAVSFRTVRVRMRTRDPFGPDDPLACDLRGALGKSLHGTPDEERLFRPALPPDGAPRGMRGGFEAPRPFVLRAPSPAELPEGGGVVEAELVSFLVDDGALAAWSAAFRAAASSGFGWPRATFHCEEVAVGEPVRLSRYAADRWDALAAGAPWARLRVSLATRTRLLSRHQLQVPTPERVVCRLLSRIQAIAWCHGCRPGSVDFAPALEAARRVQDSPDLLFAVHWEEGVRRNRRQGRDQPLDGARTWMDAWWPRPLGTLLLAGEVVGVGKGTAMGLGRIRVTAPVADPGSDGTGARCWDVDEPSSAEGLAESKVAMRSGPGALPTRG